MQRIDIVKFQKEGLEKKAVQYVGLVVPKIAIGFLNSWQNLNDLMEKDVSGDRMNSNHPFHTFIYCNTRREVYEGLSEEINEHHLDTDQHEIFLIEIDNPEMRIERIFGLEEDDEISAQQILQFFKYVKQNYGIVPDGTLPIEPKISLEQLVNMFSKVESEDDSEDDSEDEYKSESENESESESEAEINYKEIFDKISAQEEKSINTSYISKLLNSGNLFSNLFAAPKPTSAPSSQTQTEVAESRVEKEDAQEKDFSPRSFKK